MCVFLLSRSAVVTILTTLHLFTLCGSGELTPQRRSNVGVRRQARWLSSLYVLVMFACTCALVVLSDLLIGRVYTQTTLIRRVLSSKFGSDRYDTRPFWEGLQRNYECCGVHNATDWWTINGGGQATGAVLPDTCCAGVGQPPVAYKGRTTTVMLLQNGFLTSSGGEDEYMNMLYPKRRSQELCTPKEAYPMGCYDALALYVRNAAKWLSLFSFGFACIAMLGGFVGCAASYGRLSDGHGGGGDGGQRVAPTANAPMPPVTAQMLPTGTIQMRTYAESMA